MKKYIGCDMHKKFSVLVAMDERGRVEAPVKVANDSLELEEYLRRLAAGTPIAVEASGGWFWFVDVLEEAGLDVRLVHPLEAKKRMGGRNKTDTIDATGLAMLLRNGTLPEVWIPPESVCRQGLCAVVGLCGRFVAGDPAKALRVTAKPGTKMLMLVGERIDD